MFVALMWYLVLKIAYFVGGIKDKVETVALTRP